MISRVVTSLEECDHQKYGQKKKSINLGNYMKNSELLMVSMNVAVVLSSNIWVIIIIVVVVVVIIIH